MKEQLSRFERNEQALVIRPESGVMELLSVLSDRGKLHRISGDPVTLTLEEWLGLVVYTIHQPWRLETVEELDEQLPTTPIDAAIDERLPEGYREVSNWIPLPGCHTLSSHEAAWDRLQERFRDDGGMRANTLEGRFVASLIDGRIARLRVGCSTVTYDRALQRFQVHETTGWTPRDLVAHFCVLVSDVTMKTAFPASYAPFAVLGLRTIADVEAVDEAPPAAPAPAPGPSTPVPEPLAEAETPPAEAESSVDVHQILDRVTRAGEEAVAGEDEVRAGIPALRALEARTLLVDQPK